GLVGGLPVVVAGPLEGVVLEDGVRRALEHDQVEPAVLAECRGIGVAAGLGEAVAAGDREDGAVRGDGDGRGALPAAEPFTVAMPMTLSPRGGSVTTGEGCAGSVVVGSAATALLVCAPVCSSCVRGASGFEEN